MVLKHIVATLPKDQLRFDRLLNAPSLSNKRRSEAAFLLRAGLASELCLDCALGFRDDSPP